MDTKIANSSGLERGFKCRSRSIDFSRLSSIQFNCKADYANVEDKVLECVNFLTSTPFDRKNINRSYAESFLAIWISGTPDFSFNIDKTACKLIKYDLSLLSIYLAFAAKYALENRADIKDDSDICRNVFPKVIEYCSNEKNNIKLSDSIVELLKCKAA